MSRAFAESLDTTTLLHFRGSRDVRAIRASFAWHSAEVYVLGAREQVERVSEALAELDRHDAAGESPETLRPLQIRAFCDVHFFFICCYRVASMLAVVRAESGVAFELSEEDDRWLEHYRSARHALEHIDDRLPGSTHKQALQMVAPEDLGNLHGQTFTFGGKEWDVGPTAAEHLQRIVEATERQIRAALVK
jgi:hypothetical protein